MIAVGLDPAQDVSSVSNMVFSLEELIPSTALYFEATQPSYIFDVGSALAQTTVLGLTAPVATSSRTAAQLTLASAFALTPVRLPVEFIYQARLYTPGPDGFGVLRTNDLLLPRISIFRRQPAPFPVAEDDEMTQEFNQLDILSLVSAASLEELCVAATGRCVS